MGWWLLDFFFLLGTGEGWTMTIPLPDGERFNLVRIDDVVVGGSSTSATRGGGEQRWW